MSSQNALAINTVKTSVKKRALIIGLDGTTGNQFFHQTWKANKAPELRELQQSGIYTICEYDTDHRCARTHSGHRTGTDFYWLTGPGWASVLTGVDNTRHLVKDNSDVSLKVFSETTKEFPTLFSRARMNGLKTAAAGVAAFMTSLNKDKVKYGIIDYECGFQSKGPSVQADAIESCNLNYRKSFNNGNKSRDAELTEWLIEKVQLSESDLIMGVYDKIDAAGHSFGFDNNKKYLNAISTASSEIGRLLSAIERSSKTNNEEWLIVLTSDHGGHRMLAWGMHGSTYNEDEVIPFSVTLIGTKHKLRELTYPVTHLDVYPTVLKWFNINYVYSDGKVQGL